MVIVTLVLVLLFLVTKKRKYKKIWACMLIIALMITVGAGELIVVNYISAKKNLPSERVQLIELEEKLDNLVSNFSYSKNDSPERLYEFADEYKIIAIRIDYLKASIEKNEHHLPSDPSFWRVMKLLIGFDVSSLKY